MSLIEQVKKYINNNKVNIPFIFVVIGLVLAPFFQYSWVISIIACLFLKEDEID